MGAFAHGVGGDNRDTHPAGDGFEDRLVAAELETHGRIEAALAEIIVGGEARTRSALTGDETDVAQLAQQYGGLLGQAMTSRGHHDERVRHEGRRAERQVRRRTRHDVKVVMVLTQAIDDAVAVQEHH